MGYLVFFYLVIGTLCLAFAISPRKLWAKLIGIWFKNPDAVEPSDIRYGLIRFFGSIGAFFCLLMISVVTSS